VPGVNLTRSEANERSRQIKVSSYEIDLDLTSGTETFTSSTIILFEAITPGASTFIDVVGKRIIEATFNGKALDTSSYDGESVFLPAIEAKNELKVVVEAMYSKSGEGLHRFVDPADNEVYLYSQHEVADARKTFACFDQPDLKATFAISAKAPAHWQVISNNPIATVTETGSTKQWVFTTTPLLPTYLTALVAGPYHRVDDTYVGEKKVPLSLYCRKSLAPSLDADEIFKITKQGFAFYEKEFGLAYPFDKYDQLAVAEFNAGAMENAGCVTFAEDYFVFRSKVTDKNYNWRANVILHEMAHMWFGDLVTMSWWDDLWLNESFAEWASYFTLAQATRFTNSWTVFNAERKNWAYRQDQLSSTHPIVVDMHDLEAVKNNFDGITYAKGASVLQQLVSHVGKEQFIKGLRQYFAKHAWGNTTLNDLLVELEATSGRDLKPWVSTWLQTAGVNTLRAHIETSGDTYSSISVLQEAPLMPAGSKELRPHRMAVGLYDLKDGALIRRKSVEADVAGARTAISGLNGEKIADLVLLNDHDLSYGKIRFDERSIATLKNHLGDIQDPLSRALCWSATWDMLRDGELPARDYVPMVIKALAGESDVAIVSMTLIQLETAVELFTAEANRTPLRKFVADGVEALFNSSEPGSDLQLQYARAFASRAVTKEQTDHVRGALNGNIKGLTIDADLRWHILNTLVERGLATNADIDAELVIDNTANGQRYAAFARAALPDAQVKSKAFDSVINEDLSNHIQLSTIQGMQRPLQRELLAPFVARYFAVVREFWDSHSHEIAKNVAAGLYPSYIATQETLELTHKWLTGEGADAPSGLRRVMAENRDAMARALNAQACDAR